MCQMNKILCAVFLMFVSGSVLAEFIYDPICPLVEDTAMLVMTERQGGVSKMDYLKSIGNTLNKAEVIYPPQLIDVLKKAITPLVDAAYKIPVFDSEREKVRAIEEFGLFGYEACVEEANKEISERYSESIN